MHNTRPYLINFDTSQLPCFYTDVLVIGSGIAGLRAAIEAGNYGSVTLVTKDSLTENNTYHAQGGIAAHIDKPSLVNSHIKDTIQVGYGLAEPRVAKFIIAKGIGLVKELIRWGLVFDRKGKTIDLAQEGGHSKPRVLHSGGDASGKNLLEVLIRKARSLNHITILEHLFAIDLLVDKGACAGLIGYDRKDNNIIVIWSNKTILASGGAGQLYRETTNPAVATGDGIAMAYRSGAALQDLEFVQFHPTALYVAGASRALISETVRGEGAILRDKYGHRFMPDYHPQAELAPRDIVSRSIITQMKSVNDTNVYLDVRHLPASKIKIRFPGLAEQCRQFNIDIRKDLIPVRPSAHYMIGGIKTDINGQTSVHNLFAAGEVAATGFHGANRLGSNSLLEGLVMGYAAARTAGRELAAARRRSLQHHLKYAGPRKYSPSINIADVTNSLKSLMWHYAGLERNNSGLKQALKKINYWSSYIMKETFASPEGWELQNILIIANLVAGAALKRTESRGVHYRSDFPGTQTQWQKHIIINTPR
ncbi:MAG: L-aspartate oxidase [Planctomycetes bacterium]|nr:L-aspartate oxidase [Planctomycetota bacterium]